MIYDALGNVALIEYSSSVPIQRLHLGRICVSRGIKYITDGYFAALPTPDLIACQLRQDFCSEKLFGFQLSHISKDTIVKIMKHFSFKSKSFKC